MAAVGFIALVGIVGLLVHLFDPSARRMREFKAELEVREPWPDDEMIAREFATSDVPLEVPVFVRRLFARHTGWPADKLRADDDLGFFWDEADMTEFIEEVEGRYDLTFSDMDIERTPCTVRALSRLVANRTRSTWLPE